MRSLFKRLWAAVNRIEIHFRSVSDMSRSTKTLKGIQFPGSNSFKNTLKPGDSLRHIQKWWLNFVLKSALAEEKTARVRWVFHTSDYEKLVVKDEQFRKIQAFSKAKNARYSTRREPKIMDIETTACGLQVPHPYGWFWTSARKRNL